MSLWRLGLGAVAPRPAPRALPPRPPTSGLLRPRLVRPCGGAAERDSGGGGGGACGRRPGPAGDAMSARVTVTVCAASNIHERARAR